MRWLLLSLILWCQCALAQFGTVQQPMFGMLSTEAEIESITNNAARQYYWTYEDLTNGTVVAWVDRIQGSTWTRLTPAAGPEKDTNGVKFLWNTLNSTLTNTPLDPGSNAFYGFILKGNLQEDDYAVLCMTTNTAQDTDWVFKDTSFDAHSANNTLYWGAPATYTLTSEYITTNRHDIVACRSNNWWYFYTNGVYSSGAAVQGYSQWCPIFYLSSSYAGSALAGYIQELIVITNVSDPASYVSNWHNYMTNTYTWPCPP